MLVPERYNPPASTFVRVPAPVPMTALILIVPPPPSVNACAPPMALVVLIVRVPLSELILGVAPNVIVPVPDHALLLPKLRSAPPFNMPVPIKLVRGSCILKPLPSISIAPPLRTDVAPLVSPKAELFWTLITPLAFTVVRPVYVFVPLKVSIPVPLMVTVPTPVWIEPLIVTLPEPPIVKVDAVVKVPSMVRVPVSELICELAAKVMFPATVLLPLIFLKAPLVAAPVPLKLIVFVDGMVMPPCSCSTPPEPTVSVTEPVPKAPGLRTFKMQPTVAAIELAPLKVLERVNVTVPATVFVMPIAPPPNIALTVPP